MRAPRRLTLSLAVLASLALGQAAHGALITFDENGHGNIDGTPLPYAMAPGPSGVGAPVTLRYGLPFAFDATLGTLAIVDPGAQVPAELVMFGGGVDEGVWFYSQRDLADLTPDLADVGTAGIQPYGSVTTVVENGPAGSNDIFYTPLSPTSAGYVPGGVTYHIITANTPEPSVLALAGVVSLASLLRRKASRP